MKIGFDMDNVLVSTPPLVPKYVIEKFYKKKTKGTPLYRFPNRIEQSIRKISHNKIFRPKISNNIEFARSISSNNKLYLISGRYSFLKKETALITHEYELDKIFDECIFNYNDNQPHIFKSELLKRLKLDIFIDDDFQLIKFAAKENKDTQFYYLTNHNQKLTRNITAIKNIKKIKI